MKYFLLTLLLPCAQLAFPQDYDLIITNGKIIDGTGNSWRHDDIGIKGDRIVAVGNLSKATAPRVIDAADMIVAPGFIDVHAHIERNIDNMQASNFILDGVTTVITGNCGSSYTDIARYAFQLDSVGSSINVASLIGHNSVRRSVMGESMRDPTEEEQLQMESVVDAAMRNGAVGMSTGLIYIPGTYSKTSEIIGMARMVSAHGGVYASHIRDEADHVTEAIEEAINIGRVADLPVQISHFKVTYKPNWGRSEEALAQVRKARSEGIDVTIDQYPYVATSTSLNTRLPDWAFSGGRDSLLVRLRDRDIRERITEEMVQSLRAKKARDYSYAVVARYASDTTLNGLNISEINKRWGRKSKPAIEAETILQMVEKGGAQMVFFSINEDDLRKVMQYPFNMFASDAGISRYGSGVPHPRGYGTNARVLGTYVRDLGIISLEEAIRRMTSLPAQKFNLKDRGLLHEGFVADLVIFDPKTVKDQATFSAPHAYSKGIEYVIVNGKVTVENGKHIGVRNGTFLRGPGFQASNY